MLLPPRGTADFGGLEDIRVDKNAQTTVFSECWSDPNTTDERVQYGIAEFRRLCWTTPSGDRRIYYTSSSQQLLPFILPTVG